jgi:N-ethylmaleimide reductase
MFWNCERTGSEVWKCGAVHRIGSIVSGRRTREHGAANAASPRAILLPQPHCVGATHEKVRFAGAPACTRQQRDTQPLPHACDGPRSRAGVERIPNAMMAEYYQQRAGAGLLIAEASERASERSGLLCRGARPNGTDAAGRAQATAICEQGIGWLNSPGIFTDEQVRACAARLQLRAAPPHGAERRARQVAGWRLVTDAVHKRGSCIFLQLWHQGRVSHSSFRADRSLPVAPSPIRIDGMVRARVNARRTHECHSHMQINAPIGSVPFETPRALALEEIPSVVEQYRQAAERAKV